MEPALFPGERILVSQSANLLIGLQLDAPADLPGTRAEALLLTARSLASWIGGSAIGGKLFLTSYRFYFASHGANRTRGAYSIFLPTIRAESGIDGFLSDQLTLETPTASHRFVVKNAAQLLSALREARTVSLEILRGYVRADVEKVGDGVAKLWDGTMSDEALSARLRAMAEAKEGNAIEVLGTLTAIELMIDG